MQVEKPIGFSIKKPLREDERSPTLFLYGKIRRNFTMKIYDELVARGLIAQVTDEQEIRELLI